MYCITGSEALMYLLIFFSAVWSENIIENNKLWLALQEIKFKLERWQLRGPVWYCFGIVVWCLLKGTQLPNIDPYSCFFSSIYCGPPAKKLHTIYIPCAIKWKFSKLCAIYRGLIYNLGGKSLLESIVARFKAEKSLKWCLLQCTSQTLFLCTDGLKLTSFTEIQQELVSWRESVHSGINGCPDCPCVEWRTNLWISCCSCILQRFITGRIKFQKIKSQDLLSCCLYVI